MSFNEGSRLDPSQVEDRRGMSTGAKAGIGGGVALIALVASLFGINPNLVTDLLGPAADSSQQQQQLPQGSSGVDDCVTGADANAELDCRITGTANSLNAFWKDYLAQYSEQYTAPKTVLFTGQTQTACGPASSDVGPFYCPADQKAYFDLSFFDELTNRFGAANGPLAQEYVVAHEFGHHIQNSLGYLGYAQQDPRGADSGAVRTELQADCYAGLWARYASEDTGNGQPFLKQLTQQDINDALSAASAVGDDRIQQQSMGGVNSESWTHGSSAQRQKWFAQGYQTGDINKCNTFDAPDLDNP
ncbi:neutral zinc metallopeptidase [Haematomicrobium sanguinis]|uniref:KPN_02809 family neutral zinc metallopeptidase n=1 Tax=Haematomicrobium sanguinis TaxID=479106 RepID=UPI00047B69F0|nr:neutral zinc metallopeptidase [Haematomicrobium sanguinis]